MTHIRALAGKVLVTNIQQGERKIGSIIITNDNGKQHGIRPRWAKVYSVGKDIPDITIGQWVLIEHGRWTRPVKYNNIEYFAVDNTCLMAISDEEPNDETLVDI